jgi:SNF2 family DNA or RNA helicase
MPTLHGSWILQQNNSYFFVWGETWKSGVSVESTADEISIHPFACDRDELISCLQDYHLLDKSGERSKIAWQTQTIAIPSQKATKTKPPFPILSGNLLTEEINTTSLILHPWQVSGLVLDSFELVKFLANLPLGSLQEREHWLGAELHFWVQVYRWSLDLLARQKFLPGIVSQDKREIKSIWQPLLDSNKDQARLAKFSQSMPPACYAYQLERNLAEQFKTSLELAQKILLDFLTAVVDRQIRDRLEINLNNYKTQNFQSWLNSLTEKNSNFFCSEKEYQRLEAALDRWTFPIQEYLVGSPNNKLGQKLFRTCVILQPPKQTNGNEAQSNWFLKYALQALDDLEFIIDSATIWQTPDERLSIQNRTLEQPQETLLKGLGLASRLYAPIANSLQASKPTGCELNPIEVYQFIRASVWQLQDSGLGVVLPPGLASDTQETRLGIKINAEVSNKKGDRLSLKSLLEYKLDIAIGEQTVSKKEFERLLAQKSPLVEVNGQWLALQPADVRAAQAVLDRSNEAINLSVEDALRLSTGDSKTLAKLPVVSFEASGILKELINNLTDNKSVQPINKPKDFIGELRPYQAKGVGWLAFLEQWGLGACLADDMGLGKTVELIAFLLNLNAQEALNHPVLLVCPTSVLNNWEREVKKFAPTLSTLIHHGDKRNKGKDFAKAIKNKSLVITSYSLIYRDAKTLEEIDWQGIVLDEAQNIKNPTAKQSQAVRKLKAGFRISLTGTPVENRLSDLWSIIDFINPGFLGTSQFFQKRFAIPIEKYGDRDSLQTLRSLVQPFILRRLKTDKDIIQDLPEKQEMNVFCGLSKEQAEIYQELTEKSLSEIESAEGIKRRGLILTLILRLKQLCNHPELVKVKSQNSRVKSDLAILNNFSDRSGKLLRLEEMLEEIIAEDDRALIFTQFAEWGELLKPYLEKKLATEVLFLYGATSRQQRQEMVDRFQNDPDGPRIFILSLKAGGTGLNLTRANHVFHVDRWWNPAVENQATDRAFRIGQKRNVQVHKFVCTGTLEERINDTIESKKELAEQTVDSGEQWLTELDTDQLRNLLLLDRNAVIDEE